MKVLVGVFNQEKALVEASSVIVKTDCETDGARHSTTDNFSYLMKTAAGWRRLLGPGLIHISDLPDGGGGCWGDLNNV